MEENNIKVVPNEETQTESTEPKKPTYEQLNNWLNQVAMENRKLHMELQNITNIQGSLPFLFKVLEYRTMFDSDFVIQCTEIITKILTPSEPEAEKENTEE